MPQLTAIINCTLLDHPLTKPKSGHYITIADNRITSFGRMKNCPDLSSFDTIIDAETNLVTPGLINGHNHCAMTLFRGLADDLELSDWLHNHIFPAEAAHVSPEMVYWCTKLAAAEMILSGTTTVADGYFFSDKAAEALDDSGMRAVVAHGIVDFPAPSVPDPSKNIEAVKTFIEKWQHKSSRITPAVFVHAPYTCSPRTIRKAKDLADEKNVRFFIHIAESRAEQSMIIEPQGNSPIKHLANLGVLDQNSVCVHSVWLDDEDLDILAESNAGVITCPQSNLKLASGVARINDMLKRDIKIGLGTDGCASNNSLDMFREMDMLAKIQKSITGDATSMSAGNVLNCATVSGAAVIGVSECGQIAQGNRADLIMLNSSAVHLTPFYNQDLLVYAASGTDVGTVMVDGNIIMRHQQIVSFDLDEVLLEVQKIAVRQ